MNDNIEKNAAKEQQIAKLAAQIELHDSNAILSYGTGVQKKIADFSESALASVRTKDLGEAGALLGEMIGNLKRFNVNEEPKRGLLGLFRRGQKNLSALQTKYKSAESNVEKVCTLLEDHQVQLMKDVALLDKMYETNQQNFEELSLYIAAGKAKLSHAREVELPALVKKAEESGLAEDAQAANDFASLCERFEKKVHDLLLTKEISLQMAPQIRLVQQNDTVMSEKIQSTLVNTIPLWKSQMLLALGVNHSLQAAEAQREVSEMTNQLLKSNAEKIKQATSLTMREAERGIVDLETLQQTNATLIETLDEVLTIQNEGREKRRHAEDELQKLEGELKQKLLEIQNQ